MNKEDLSPSAREDLPVEDRIQLWQEERLLTTKEYDVKVVSLNILEEVVEMNYNVASEDARIIANAMFIGMTTIAGQQDFAETTDHEKVDALCDMKVYASGGILQLGFDPTTAMQETLTEIESRQGMVIDGKFTKFTTREATMQWVTADYNKAKHPLK